MEQLKAESKWLNGDSAYALLDQLPEPFDYRKLQLFKCACLRRVWHAIRDHRSRRCVEAVERIDDGERIDEEIVAAYEAYQAAESGTLNQDIDEDVVGELPMSIGPFAAQCVAVASAGVAIGGQHEESRAQVRLLRCVFGNPFRPPGFDPSWLSIPVVGLAKAAYHERELPSGILDVARLGVLADALEEVGCNNADILAHLRGPGPHVRGCWALDLILGKS